MLALIGEGLTVRQASTRLGVRYSTARAHLNRVLMKLGATSAAHAITLGYRAGVLPAPPPGVCVAEVQADVLDMLAACALAASSGDFAGASRLGTAAVAQLAAPAGGAS